MVNISAITNKMIVFVNSSVVSVEKMNLLNDENNNSTATGGKMKPIVENANEINGGIKPGKFAFFLKTFEHVNTNIMQKAAIKM